jgi:hypothetical protein
MARNSLFFAAAVFFFFLVKPALAQPEIPLQPGASAETRIARLEAQLEQAKGAGDNSWVLVSSALVLMMTGPGLALFYGGLVRKKNVLATMMQSFTLMAVVTVLWSLVGFSLAFGSGNPVIGGLHHAFLRGVGAQPDADYAATIPLQTFMVFQLMFAIITPSHIRRLCRAHEIQRDGALHGFVVLHRLQSAGSHGLGQRRVAQCSSGREHPDA